MIKRLMFASIFLLYLVGAFSTVQAQNDAAGIVPHLGYGIHFGPNTGVDKNLVSQMGMDWVKIYELGHAWEFPGKKILYRFDLRWTQDWDAFKRNIADHIRAVANSPVDAIEIGNEPNLSIEWGY